MALQINIHAAISANRAPLPGVIIARIAALSAVVEGHENRSLILRDSHLERLSRTLSTSVTDGQTESLKLSLLQSHSRPHVFIQQRDLQVVKLDLQ